MIIFGSGHGGIALDGATVIVGAIGHRHLSGPAFAGAAYIFSLGEEIPPIVSNLLASPNPAPVNAAIVLTADIDDSTTGNSNIASASYTLDGGTPVAMSAVDSGFDNPTESVTAAIPAFTEASVHEVCVTGDDASGNTSNEECVLLAVYDPSAGFVTGGGWIDSLAGAYRPDAGLTGKANFGFVAKYKKGTNVPDGNTEFQFKAGGLNFHSSSYEWLVVAGAKAQFKGVGTINGEGTYGFMLFAIDGAINGGGGTDKFRIKIWDKEDSDTVVYDNNYGGDDDANPTTLLGGGSIIIHKAK